MALDSTKTDLSIGEEIRKLLVEKGVETPMMDVRADKHAAFCMIESSMKDVMRVLGLDLHNDSLKETPKRIAKMYLNEIFWGLDYSNFPKVTCIENSMQYSSMLLERHIKVHSVCEHHFIPIMGEAFVAYIPNERIIGLSKLNRIVEFFCRRPQVQERLCEQIFYTLSHILGTESIAVLIKAEHTCVKLRGVEDVNSDTVTCRLGGAFFEGTLRNEFYQMIKMQ